MNENMFMGRKLSVWFSKVVADAIRTRTYRIGKRKKCIFLKKTQINEV